MAFVDVDFLIEHGSGHGLEFMVAAVSNRPDLAMAFLDEGWFEKVRRVDLEKARDFLFELNGASSPELSKAFLVKCLQGRSVENVNALLCMGSSAPPVMHRWTHLLLVDFDATKNIDEQLMGGYHRVLVDTGVAYGADLNHEFMHAPSRPGTKKHRIKAHTVLSAAILETNIHTFAFADGTLTVDRMLSQAENPSHPFGCVDSLLNLGAKVDGACASALMSQMELSTALLWTSFLVEKGACTHQSIVDLARLKAVKGRDEEFAVFQALAAGEAIQSMLKDPSVTPLNP